MQPPEILALSDELRGFTERAWQQLQDTQNAILDTWPQASRDARRQRLQDLKDTAARLTSQVDELALALATGGIHTAYTMGAEAGGITQYTAVDVEALGVLAQDLYDGVLASTRGVSNSTKLLIRTLAREHIADRLLGGQTAQDAARELRKELEAKSIYSVTYADGSRQGLGSYVEMLSRTQSALAYNTGNLNAATKAGVQFMEVFDGYGCGFIGHSDLDKANGTIRPVEECAKAVISHPRCVMPGQRFASYGRVTEGLRARYRGPAFTLKTGVGSLTVGPHHPVLTRRGWLPAYLLDKGDEVVYDQRLRHIADAGSAAGLDLEEVPLVEDAFVAAGPSTRGQLGTDDLHGDAVFCEDEVDVVAPAGELLVVDQTTGIEKRCQLDLVGANRRLVDVAGQGHPLALGVSMGPVVVGSGGSADAALGSFRRQLLPRHAQARTGVTGDIGLERQPSNVGRAASEPLPHLVGALAGEVGGNQGFGVDLATSFAGAFSGAVLPRLPVVSLEDLDAADKAWTSGDHDLEFTVLQDTGQSFYDGWVYDFSTTEGAFNVGGFVVKNCQRSFGPRPDVTSADEAKDAPRSQTPAQAADQQQVAEQRQARVEQRAQRLAARQAKLDQRAGVSA